MTLTASGLKLDKMNSRAGYLPAALDRAALEDAGSHIAGKRWLAPVDVANVAAVCA